MAVSDRSSSRVFFRATGLTVALLVAFGRTQTSHGQPAVGNSLPLNWPAEAREATCAATGPDGTVFTGTLRSGLFAASAPQGNREWHRLGRKDGLGQDDITALHVDQQGRIWVGHRSAGVSVLVGGRPTHYPPGKGPIGQRVWDIAHCPVDGDVWIVHDRGLSRYGIKSSKWQHFTRADGLPTCHLRCVSFADDGTLIVGTQAEGLLVASREGVNYPNFCQIDGARNLTRSPTGAGLPSSLVNDVLVDRAGRWLVATDRGLAISDDKGQSFTYHRGREWSVKLQGLYKPVEPEAAGQEAWLPDDYVTTLAEDGDGRVWLGFERAGVMVLEPNSLRAVYHGDPRAQVGDAIIMPELKSLRWKRGYEFYGDCFCVRALLPRPGQPTIAVGFGVGGHLVADGPVAIEVPARPRPLAAAVVPRADTPNPRAYGLSAELAWAREQLDRVSKDSPALVALPDDWATQGDWIGSYGGLRGVLCAAQSPHSIYVGTNQPRIRYANMIGPHRRTVTFQEKETVWNRAYDGPDSLRYWIWDHFTSDRRALQLPPEYVKEWIGRQYPMSKQLTGSRASHRRPCGVDDHAEAYSIAYDGPSVQVAIGVPEGVYQVAMYFLNYDGHAGPNRMRDYRLLVHHHTNRFLGEIGDIETLPPLSLARVVDFHGGVYKKMLVRGPLKLAIEINRNHTFNTMLSGVFVDAWSDKAKALVMPGRESLTFSIKP
jgi:hypothetical protein